MYGNDILNHKKAVENMLNNKIKRGYKDQDTIVYTAQEFINDIIWDNYRPSYALNYKNPIEYRAQLILFSVYFLLTTSSLMVYFLNT